MGLELRCHESNSLAGSLRCCACNAAGCSARQKPVCPLDLAAINYTPALSQQGQALLQNPESGVFWLFVASAESKEGFCSGAIDLSRIKGRRATAARHTTPTLCIIKGLQRNRKKTQNHHQSFKPRRQAGEMGRPSLRPSALWAR